jgi:hypothetical protein
MKFPPITHAVDFTDEAIKLGFPRNRTRPVLPYSQKHGTYGLEIAYIHNVMMVTLKYKGLV